MSDPLDDFLALRENTHLPSTLGNALAALRKLVSADAVLLVETSSAVLLVASASPSQEISENLMRTAAPMLQEAPRKTLIVKKFTFREQSVQMLAESCGNTSSWLVVWSRCPDSDLDTIAPIVRLAAQCLPMESSREAAPSSAALKIISSFLQPKLVRMNQFAEEGKALLGGKNLYVARRKFRGWHIEGSAPAPAPAPRSFLHESLLFALSAHGADKIPTLHPAQNSHPSLAEICRITHSNYSAVIPAGENWALIATWDSPSPPEDATLPALAALFPLLPPLHRFSHRWSTSWKNIWLFRRPLWTAFAIAVVILLLMPFHLRVYAPAILEPSTRRFIAAPFDCILNKVHVEAGDIVAIGSLLAELDGKELRERIAEIESQSAAANLQSASDLANSRFGESSLSALQAQRAGHELEVFKERERNLKILSPIAGVVIQGDLEREEGAALKLGRSIMEIAPLDTMVVEIAIREEDAAFVHHGQKISLLLHALPSENIEALISKVNPRAETRDGRNVFIAEATITNQTENFRPGMKGEAVIIADRMPLFWALFRKPWNAVRSWLFW